MLVIVGEIFLIAYFLKHLDIKGIKTKIYIAFIMQAILLVLYRINLMFLGRDVYYSDAETYWKEVLILLEGDKLEHGQVGYAYFTYLIQKTSPFVSVLWNNISNWMLTNLSVLALANMAKKSEVNIDNIKTFLLINMYNPLIYYALFRNLKDALFLFSCTIMIYGYVAFRLKKRKIYLVVPIIVDLWIATVRPWGFLILPMFILVDCFSVGIKKIIEMDDKKKLLKPLIAFGVVGTIVFVVFQIMGLNAHLYTWIPVIMQDMKNLGIMNVLLGPFRMILGPGWYRCLFGAEYFEFYTLVGNIVCLIGVVFWWGVLAFSMCNIKMKNMKYSLVGKYALILILMILGLYSLRYGGSTEIRFRGVIYIVMSASVLFNLKKFSYKKRTIGLAVSFAVIFIIGTIFSV